MIIYRYLTGDTNGSNNISLGRQHWLAIILLAILFSNTAYGADHYVDNSSAPACSDTPSYGTEANPWCTINYGIARMGRQDNLYVKAGIYREGVYINRPAGSVGKDTLIKAYPGHRVTIYGNGVNTGRVKITNTSHVTFDGFIITNFNQGLFVESAHHITVQNCTVYNVGQEGIHVLRDSSYVTIQNNRIHDTRKWQYNGEGIYVGTGSRGPLDNTHHVTVRNNTIYNTTDEAIELKAGTHDCVVEGNTIYNCTTDPAWQAKWGNIEVNEAIIGIQHWRSNPDHIIRNNIIHDTKTGIRAGTGCRVYNNVIYNIGSPFYGIYIDNNNGDSYPREIYHNTVDITGSRAIAISSGISDVKNNIGPNTANNMTTSHTYYVNKAGANYRLVAGSAPINAGLDLTSIVPNDIEGNSRSAGFPPDLGAYEYKIPDASSAIDVHALN